MEYDLGQPRPDTVPLAYERAPQSVPVARFADPAEARMAASFLAGENVESELIDHARLAGMTSLGATLAVDAEDVPRAAALLSTTPARRCLLARPALPAVDHEPRRREPPLLRWLRKLRDRGQELK
jgi:hypothetical protein